jgi:ABC-type amino acid transport substrate-binding protein/mono/diheme cytochrome c family protein
VFFSEEKNQKTFSMLSRTFQAAHTAAVAKVFCFFSSEKKTFLAFFLCLAATAATAQAPLRLCADPTNPPFSSNQPGAPGMYLELGAAIGQALDRPVQPVWQMTYYGQHATRETLLAGTCDMSVGLPADGGFMGRSLVFSHPFLRVGFALVTRPGQRAALSALRGKTVAVQLGSPPQSLLAAHDEIIMSTFVNPEDAMQALADGRADAAFVWGPSAGYMNHTRLHDRFTITPMLGEGMQWNVGIGFARRQAKLRDQVDSALAGLGGTVAQLAEKYGFPLQAPVRLGQTDETPGEMPVMSRALHAGLMYDGAAPRLPIILADSVVELTDDQKDAVDRVASGATEVDKAFRPAAAPGAASEGRTIFNGTCNHCHGPDAEQSVRKIDLRLLHHRYGTAMDQVFHYTVTHGRESKGMPNWSGVFTEQDFAKILAFLHGVQTE